MAMVQFAVAKARLVNALLQPKVGEEALTMPVIDEFFDGLHRAVSHNAYIAITPPRQFLSKHVSQHPDRVALLIQYFTQYSEALGDNDRLNNRVNTTVGFRMNQHGHSVKALRYNLLCLLADMMGHAHDNKVIISGIAMALKLHIKDFIRSVSATYEGLDPSFNVKWYNSTHPRYGFEIGLVPILKDWLHRRFFPRKFILELNSIARNAARFDDADPPQPNFPSTDEPYEEDDTNWRLPMVHGIPGAPWYEQPAALQFEHFEPGQPIETARIKPKELNGAPAKREHVDAVKDLLSFAKHLKENGPRDELTDVDEIGQYMNKDKSGEAKKDATYYGWSPEFIQSLMANGHTLTP